MKNIVKIKVANCDKLKCGLRSFVEMEIDYTQCSFDTSTLKTDYFGTFENDEFVVYHRKVDIVVVGDIKENELTINYNFPCRWNYLFDIVIFTIVGISIMYDINTYIGLAIILFVLGQKIYLYLNEENKKVEFQQKLIDILKQMQATNDLNNQSLE